MFRIDDPVIARGAPFVLFIVLLIVGTLLPAEPASWLVVARAGVIALVLAWFWRSYGELRQPRAVSGQQWFAAVVAGTAVFAVWILADHDWIVADRSGGFSPLLEGGGIDWVKGGLRLAGFALVVPVMEELFWRSLVLRWIERHDFLALAPQRVGSRAFLITTVLFALEHDRWLAGAAAGAAYNWLYMRSGNLWVPIVAHGVTNVALGTWILFTREWLFW